MSVNRQSEAMKTARVPAPPATAITAWSPSRLFTYEKCPALAKYKFVQKLAEPQGEAAARGDDIHKKAEAYLRGKQRTLPKELEKLADVYKTLKKLQPAVELELAFDSKWARTDWFSKQAWCRVKIDAIVAPVVDTGARTVLYDHKTGGVDKKTGQLRVNPEYDDQVELYGLTGLKLHATADSAQGILLFVDAGVAKAGPSIPRKDEPKLQKKWEKRVFKMLVDKRFVPTPGEQCRYCYFRNANGGPCVY